MISTHSKTFASVCSAFDKSRVPFVDLQPKDLIPGLGDGKNAMARLGDQSVAMVAGDGWIAAAPARRAHPESGRRTERCCGAG
jgi:hypothetical protein